MRRRSRTGHPMSEHDETLGSPATRSPVELDVIREKYTALREAQRALNEKLVTMLPKQAISDSARKLGLWRDGGIWVEHDDDLAVLTDFAVYDYRLRGGTNAVERLWKQQGTSAGTPSHAVLEAMQHARFTVLQITELVPGVGVTVDDVLYGGDHFLADVGLSDTAEPGVAIGTRVLTLPDFCMTTGATFAVDPEPILRIVAVLNDESDPDHVPMREFTTKDRTWLASLIIRGALAPDGEDEDEDASE